MSKTVTLSQCATILGRLKFEEACRKGIFSAANRGVQIIVTEIIPARSPEPVDRAVYKAGWRAEPIENGAMIINREPHASIIEYGARAANIKIGRLMINALASWVVRKGLGSKEEAKSIAWAIALAMKKRGIFNKGGGEGMKILTEFVKERAQQVVRTEVTREARRMVRATL